MAIAVLAMIPLAATLSWLGVALATRLAHRAGAIDTAPMPGQTKMAPRSVPNVGGIGIVWAVLAPLAMGLAAVWLVPIDAWPESLAEHVPGARSQTPLGLSLLLSLGAVHAVGVIDDRRPLGPRLKLGLVAAATLAVSLLPQMLTGDAHSGTRLLTVLDQAVGGWWLSVALTVIWFLAVTNAMNFIDNMDGLTGGVAAIAGAAFLASAAMSGQWFVAGVLALLVGACLGFLPWNFPRAKCFMGDGGSLSIGFLLAFLTARTTYVDEGFDAGGWYAVLTPLLVLAVPLYDMVVVTCIRLAQGRSPMVGDLQHLSHRLVRRGLSRPIAVVVIWGFTATLAIPAITLSRLEAHMALLVGAQAAVLLGTLAVLEWASVPVRDDV